MGKESPLTLARKRLCHKFAIRNQINAFLQEHLAGGRQSQYTKFHLPRFAQTGRGALQIRVVIAGMANELPGAWRNVAGDRMKKRLVESPCDDNAEGAVRRSESIVVY